jgi:hypothetical protein
MVVVSLGPGLMTPRIRRLMFRKGARDHSSRAAAILRRKTTAGHDMMFQEPAVAAERHVASGPIKRLSEV